MGRRPKHTGCKFKDCRRKHYTRGFCQRHATAFYKGHILEDGTPTEAYIPRPDASYCKYPDCGSRGTTKNTLRNGLCNKHRKWKEKGIIDADCNVLDSKRLPKKKELEVYYVDGMQYVFKRKCEVEDCMKESRRAGFCTQHSSSYYQGKRNKDGTPTYDRKYYNYDKDKCKVEGCNHIQKNKRLVKGFCLYHYNNPYRKGLIDVDGKPTRKAKRLAKKKNY